MARAQRGMRHWTPPEEARLRDLWDSPATLGGISRVLCRSQWAIYRHAEKLGLPLGVALGFESLRAASRRTGYHVSQLHKILAWAKVQILPVRAPARGRRAYHRLMVDQLDVDEALERWHATETVSAAARRMGVGIETLRVKVLALGIRGRGRGHPIRVTEAQVQAALQRAA